MGNGGPQTHTLFLGLGTTHCSKLVCSAHPHTMFGSHMKPHDHGGPLGGSITQHAAHQDGVWELGRIHGHTLGLGLGSSICPSRLVCHPQTGLLDAPWSLMAMGGPLEAPSPIRMFKVDIPSKCAQVLHDPLKESTDFGVANCLAQLVLQHTPIILFTPHLSEAWSKN